MARRFATVSILVLAALLAAPAAAPAARWSLRGAGWGHGIGMSQYGAYGLARHGRDHREILRHYYTGTSIGNRSGQTVRVLLQANRGRVAVRGATSAGGRRLAPGSTYRARRSGSRVVLRDSSGRVVASAQGTVSVRGRRAVRLLGAAQNGTSSGRYRDAIEIRTASGPGLNAINAIGLDQYVKGVVASESPSSWPAAELRAQAVAARSYALATDVGGKGFDQYADTRSQVYRGVGGETRATNAAVARTRGEVVTYRGKVAVTYFFSTSGGHTEDVQNVFLGSKPQPWLKGVEDPYDTTSPYHRWGPYRYTTGQLTAKLGNLVKGAFEGLDVVKRGSSPRIVRARVRGSRGSTLTTGPALRARLGLRDTWFSLRRASARDSRP
ncbi:MAG: SpoIID/LytB domain-containing protein [Solirubrobacterales bacterium]